MNLFKKSFLSIVVLFFLIIGFGTLVPTNKVSAAVPSVGSPSYSSVTSSSATLGGYIYSNGGFAITQRGVCYTIVSGPPTTPFGTCVVEGGTATGAFTKSVTGLNASTNYYFYPYAKNSSGTSIFPIGQFTTSAATVPILTTKTPITSIAQTTATGGGTISSNGGATVTVSGLVWSTSINPTTANSKTTNGWAIGGPWTSGMTGLTGGTLYHVRAYATNSAGTAYGADVTFTTLKVPTVINQTSSSITTTSATLGGSIMSAGNPATITERGVCYTIVSGPPTTPFGTCVVEGGTSTGTFSKSVTGLTAGTNYYYYPYAKNSTGTSSFPIGQFTTTANPTGTITASNCTISAGGSSCTTSLVWSTTNPITTSSVTTPTSITVVTANSSAGQNFVVAYGSRTFYLYNNATLLAQATANATCASGTSWNGTTCQTLTVPTVLSSTATSITQSSATLGGYVSSAGYPATITARGTCWGTTTNPTTNCLAASGTTTGAFTHSRTSMSCGTTIYYRAYATNSTGTGYSTSSSFTTSACNIVPSITSPTSSSVGQTSATLGANVTSLGIPATLTARGVCYRAYGTASYFNGLSTCVSNLVSTTGAFTKSVTGLSCAVSYNYVGYAGNSMGIVETGQGTFTTSACNNVPTVTTPTVSSISTTSATLGANVTSLGVPGVITARGTCWGTTTNPTTNCVAASGTTTGTFTHARTGLTPGTTYYYRGYATNSTGTGYSTSASFTTTAVVPTLTTTTPITSIASTTATGGGTISSNGGATVTVSGLVWSTSINPTTANSKTTNGWAIGGPWTSGMTGLTANTLYHVRAYATNSAGTAYGADVTFTTSNLAIFTAPAELVTQTSATFSATQDEFSSSSLGGREYGFVYGTSVNPTTANTKVSHLIFGSLPSSWSDDVTGLTADTNYHVRAYLIYDQTTMYGNDVTFWTESNIPTDVKVTDYASWLGTGLDTVWGSNLLDGPIMTYYNAPYSLTLEAMTGATSCTISGMDGTYYGYNAYYTSQTHTVHCTDGITSDSDSVTINTPPPPLTFTKTCNTAGDQVTLNWTLSSGYTGGYVRGPAPFSVDVASGLTTTIAVTPSQTYSGVYLMTKASNGAWSEGRYLPDFSCNPPAPIVTVKANTFNPLTVPYGTVVNITWTSQNATSCIRTDTGETVLLNSGLTGFYATMSATKTFTIQCSN